MTLIRTLVPLLSLCLACSGKKAPKQEPGAATTEAASNSRQPKASPVPAGLAAGPFKVVRTQQQARVRKRQDGQSFSWQSMDRITVSGESLKQLYVSQGSNFIGFKASVKTPDTDCIVRWKAQLIDTPTGRGKSVDSITGTAVVLASDTATIVSGVVALSAEQASSIGSVSAGYWTLCGEKLYSPSAIDFHITETKSEQTKLGNTFDLHHTLLSVQSEVNAAKSSPQRCYFNLVSEDIDTQGYTLNRDFALFSLLAEQDNQAKLRRTDFNGGKVKDFGSLVAGKRSYVNEVSCAGPWPAKSATLEGIKFENLRLHPYQEKGKEAEHMARAHFEHSAQVTNTLQQDCSFRVRYQMLDAHGIALHKAPVLSEVLHLKAGATAQLHSTKHRLYTWRNQAQEAKQVVVQDASPVGDCSRFDGKKAL